MIESAYSVNLFLHQFRTRWGYWLPFWPFGGVGSFPSHQYCINHRCRSLAFCVGSTRNLSILESVVPRSYHYMYEVGRSGKYSCIDVSAGNGLGRDLRVIEDIWKMYAKKRKGYNWG
jgi:hypothetical protein